MQNFKIEITRLQKNTNSVILTDLRSTLLNSYYVGLKSVEPETLIRKSVRISLGKKNEIKLSIEGVLKDNLIEITKNITNIEEIVIIGGGKATGAMTSEIIKILGKFKECTGIINVPYNQNWGKYIEFSYNGLKSSIKVNYCSHPIPDENGYEGTTQMVELLNKIKKRKKDALIFTLISGGGSALMAYPKKGVKLKDLQDINSRLLKSNASIHEINAVRKHLSDFKGGNLAKLISPMVSFVLIISDVIGDDLDVIASGPTVPDASTYDDAKEILEKYDILKSVNQNVTEIILKGIRKEIDENPKTGDPTFLNTKNVLIGSAKIAKNHIENNLINNGVKNWRDINNEIIFPIMIGPAVMYAKKIAQSIKNIDNLFSMNDYEEVYYLVNSGELTISVKGKGTGGRNQEMLLLLLMELKTIKIENIDYCICSMAFDGIEGNSPAAGGVIDTNTINRIEKMDLIPSKYVSNNDSYNFFKILGDQIEIGQTNTNVNDIIGLIFKKRTEIEKFN